MGSWSVSCASCASSWNRMGGASDYERESIESHPCPACGAYTLRCTAAAARQQTPKRRRREERYVV